MIVSSVNNVNFGMAIKATPQAKEYLKHNLNEKDINKLAQLVKFAEKDSVNVSLRTEERHMTYGPGANIGSPYTQLFADVETEVKDSYKPKLDGFSFSIIRAIKKAVNAAHSLSEKQKTINNMGL